MNKFLLNIKKTLSRITGTRMIYGYINKNGIFLKNTRISNTAYIFSEKTLSIDDNVFIGHFSVLDATFGLTIEEGCQIGFFTGIFTHSSHDAIRLYGKNYMNEPRKIAYHTAPVHIGAYTFIGAHSTILPGSTIGKGCVISAYSLVSGYFPDFSIVSGNPAKIIGSVKEKDARFLQKHPEISPYYMGAQPK